MPARPAIAATPSPGNTWIVWPFCSLELEGAVLDELDGCVSFALDEEVLVLEALLAFGFAFFDACRRDRCLEVCLVAVLDVWAP